MELQPEYCWRCRDVAPVYAKSGPEGTAINCEVCDAGLDFVFADDESQEHQTP